MTDKLTNRGRIIQAVLLVAVGLLALTVWRQRAELERAKAEKALMSAAPEVREQTAPALPTTSDQPASVEAAVPASAPIPHLELTPTGKMAPPPRTSGLVLADTQVKPFADGLRATLRFTPTTTEPLGIIDFVVRLPRDADSKILGLDPSDPTRYADVAQRVSEDGKFAIFHGVLADADTVEFILSVSGETTADVRGTTGMGPFDLVIRSGGATVTAK